MSRVLTNENNYYDIANTIRQMKNVNTTYKPRQMASALKDIYSNEVEGVPPLSFEANGNNLLDYRIDGASGGVGDRTKNLLQNTATSQTVNGVTFTVNNDKSITCNGTATGTAAITINTIFSINSTKISGCPMGGSWSSFELDLLNINTNNVDVIDTGNGAVIQNENSYRVRIRIASGYTCNNLTFYPMIRLADIEDNSYEPYGYKVPVIISGKNLLPTPEVKSQTKNGVTISRLANGIITIKGTPTAQMDVKFNFEESTFSAGSYIHLRNNFSTYNFAVSFRKDGVNKIAPGLGTLNSIKQITEDITVNQLVVLCNNNAIGTNYDITIQPSIELTNEETSYEPYHEPTTTTIYLDNPIRTVEDEVEYIDYSEKKQHRVRKNLLQNTATTQTKNGVTFTVNEDKSISCNGTASGNAFFKIGDIQLEENCIMSGCPEGGNNNSYLMRLYNNGSVLKTDSGDGVLINSEIQNGYAEIRIAVGYTCDNLTFYPMIRLAEIEDNTYEPYVENTEVDVTLPAIPTLDGTNVISIDTTVQPSNVYIQAPKDTPKMIEARERLEVI